MTESKAQSQPEEEEEENESRCFDININNKIDSEFVKSLTLPSILMFSPGNPQQRGSVLLTLHMTHKACKQTLLAAKEGFDHFKINFRDGNIESEDWELHGARIVALDFGAISQTRAENKNEIQCEVQYEFLEIDGVKL